MVARNGCACSPNTSPKRDGTALGTEVFKPELLDSGLQFRCVVPGLADAGKIAFHIGSKNRHANSAEVIRDNLKGHCFACTRCSGHQAMPVCHSGQQVKVIGSLRD